MKKNIFGPAYVIEPGPKSVLTRRQSLEKKDTTYHPLWRSHNQTMVTGTKNASSGAQSILDKRKYECLQVSMLNAWYDGMKQKCLSWVVMILRLWEGHALAFRQHKASSEVRQLQWNDQSLTAGKQFSFHFVSFCPSASGKKVLRCKSKSRALQINQ